MVLVAGRARAWAGGVIAVAIWTSPLVHAGGGEIRFTIGEGRVTLVARNAPLGEVIAAWERAGSTRFVDAGGLDAVPVSLHLVDVPEAMALRLLLRPAAGYVAMARAPSAPGASLYDRVEVLAVRATPSRPRSAAALRALPPPAAGAAGGGAEDGRGNGPPPAELSEAAQIERLQRLLRPRESGGESAAAATEAVPRARAPRATPRPGMLVDSEQGDGR